MKICVYKRFILFGVIVVTVCSCSQKNIKTKRTLAEMEKEKVILPLSQMSCLHSAVDTLARQISGNFSLVHYVDSSQCSPCALNKMYFWNELIDEYSRKGVRFIFIFEPKKEQLEDVHFSIESSGLRNQVYVDSAFAFRKQNPFILKTKVHYHTFLVDNDIIVVVGNPMQNEKVKFLMDKYLEKYNMN